MNMLSGEKLPSGFDRTLRLLRSAEYARVFGAAEVKVSDRNLLILACSNQLGIPRLGLVVAKKNVRTAVSRNRVKRVVRETFRCSQRGLRGLDYVVLARKGLGDLDSRQLHTLLGRQWALVRSRSDRFRKS
ncbi:MAG: ribonuclease P protein component [Kistimonas sp.]|nr:ribonuclease P protein component [Kistimonas sp.]